MCGVWMGEAPLEDHWAHVHTALHHSALRPQRHSCTDTTATQTAKTLVYRYDCNSDRKDTRVQIRLQLRLQRHSCTDTTATQTAKTLVYRYDCKQCHKFLSTAAIRFHILLISLTDYPSQ